MLFADGRIAVTVADVAGKGMAAALLMSSTRGILRVLAEHIVEPAEMLQRLNKALLRDFPRARFVTMAYILLDPNELTARIALAGHPPPVLIMGDAHLIENAGGIPLGMLDAGYPDQRISLTPGARLVLYFDGVLETQNPNGAEYGFAGIERFCLTLVARVGSEREA
jgi:sigma-B regulation protein RsbU (phosphoserine phosphatase)